MEKYRPGAMKGVAEGGSSAPSHQHGRSFGADSQAHTIMRCAVRLADRTLSRACVLSATACTDDSEFERSAFPDWAAELLL